MEVDASRFASIVLDSALALMRLLWRSILCHIQGYRIEANRYSWWITCFRVHWKFLGSWRHSWVQLSSSRCWASHRNLDVYICILLNAEDWVVQILEWKTKDWVRVYNRVVSYHYWTIDWDKRNDFNKSNQETTIAISYICFPMEALLTEMDYAIPGLLRCYGRIYIVQVLCVVIEALLGMIHSLY